MEISEEEMVSYEDSDFYEDMSVYADDDDGYTLVGKKGKPAPTPVKSSVVSKPKPLATTLESMEMVAKLPIVKAEERTISSFTGDDEHPLLPKVPINPLDRSAPRSFGPMPSLPACPPVYFESWMTGVANEANRQARLKSQGTEVITPAHVTKDANIRPLGSIPYARGGRRLVALPPHAVPKSGEEGTLFVYGSDKGVYHQTPEGGYQRISSASPVRRVPYNL
jgi:hypothetical protein